VGTWAGLQCARMERVSIVVLGLLEARLLEKDWAVVVLDRHYSIRNLIHIQRLEKVRVNNDVGVEEGKRSNVVEDGIGTDNRRRP
jgi:hypothetical protein